MNRAVLSNIPSCAPNMAAWSLTRRTGGAPEGSNSVSTWRSGLGQLCGEGLSRFHRVPGFQGVCWSAPSDTYGLELKRQFVSLDLALGTYRRTVGTIIPGRHKNRLVPKSKEIVQARPGMTKRKFLYNLERLQLRKGMGNPIHPPRLVRPVYGVSFSASCLKSARSNP